MSRRKPKSKFELGVPKKNEKKLEACPEYAARGDERGLNPPTVHILCFIFFVPDADESTLTHM
jgi:hypothetical protein